MELRDYLRVLRKQWRLITLSLLLAVGAAAALTAAASPQYRSSVTFFVSTPETDTGAAYSGGLFSQQRVRSYADIVEGSAAIQAVLDNDRSLDDEQVEGRVSATALPETVLLEATVTGASAEEAQRVATALAESFPGLVTRLEQQDGGVSPVKVSVVEQPELPGAPFSPQPVRNLALAAVLGLLLGFGLAVLRETLDNTVKSPEDIVAAAGTSTLGVIAYEAEGTKRPLVVHDSPRSPRSEAFRKLRTNLQFAEVGTELRSILVTSSVPGEGKTTTACNLALTLAQAGVRVCLVEGDLRRPRVGDYLGLVGAVGMTNVLIGTVPLDDALQPWGDGRLNVLASGPLPPNPSELLASARMDDLLRELTARYDMVVVDAPPLLPVTDAAVLSTCTAGVLLVTRARRTRREQLARAAETVRAVDGRIVGVVLNMVPTRGPDAGYAYGYGYQYGSYEADKRGPRLSAADTPPVVAGRAGRASSAG